MELDFSVLTDDQLIELIRQAVTEAERRNEATFAAAQSIGLDAAARQRIQQREAERVAAEQRAAQEEAAREAARAQAERERQAKLWRQKGELALVFKEALGSLDGWEVNVWERGGDKRVYLQRVNQGRAKACLYVTGNSRQAPGALEMDYMTEVVKGLTRVIDRGRFGKSRVEDPEAVEAFKPKLLAAMQQAARWTAGLRLSLAQAAQFAEEAVNVST